MYCSQSKYDMYVQPAETRLLKEALPGIKEGQAEAVETGRDVTLILTQM